MEVNENIEVDYDVLDLKTGKSHMQEKFPDKPINLTKGVVVRNLGETSDNYIVERSLSDASKFALRKDLRGEETKHKRLSREGWTGRYPWEV